MKIARSACQNPGCHLELAEVEHIGTWYMPDGAELMQVREVDSGKTWWVEYGLGLLHEEDSH